MISIDSQLWDEATWDQYLKYEAPLSCDVTHDIAAAIIDRLSSSCPALKKKFDKMHEDDYHQWIVELCGTVKEVLFAHEKNREKTNQGLDERLKTT